jgi:hypothetical protein
MIIKIDGTQTPAPAANEVNGWISPLSRGEAGPHIK